MGWSTYFADVMKQAGMVIPAFAYGDGHNLVAALIVLILTCVICLGIRVSSQVNLVMVTIKIAVVLFVIVAGPFYIKTSNYSPFIPPTGSTPAEGAESVPSLLQDLGFAPGSFGIGGIFTGAALVFFEFIGFDIVATAAEAFRSVGKPAFATMISIDALIGLTTVMMILMLGEVGRPGPEDQPNYVCSTRFAARRIEDPSHTRTAELVPAGLNARPRSW